jgi:hypothetical protein
MDRSAPGDGILIGEGALHWGPRRIGSVSYKIHFSTVNGQASVVELKPKPPVKNGALMHLTLEDGRVINCQVLDDSPFCAVIGDGPMVGHRKRIRDK